MPPSSRSSGLVQKWLFEHNICVLVTGWVNATHRVALLVYSYIAARRIIAGKQYNGSESKYAAKNHLPAFYIHSSPFLDFSETSTQPPRSLTKFPPFPHPNPERLLLFYFLRVAVKVRDFCATFPVGLP